MPHRQPETRQRGQPVAVTSGSNAKPGGAHIAAVGAHAGDACAALIAQSTAPSPGADRELRLPSAHGADLWVRARHVAGPDGNTLWTLNDITTDSHHRRHGVSSITVDPHRMGRACGAAMLAWLAGSRPAARTLVQTATFQPRGTTGAAAR